MEIGLYSTTALSATAALIVLFRRIALMIGLVDLPGGHKTHHHPTPLVGGLSIYIGFVLVLMLVIGLKLDDGLLVPAALGAGLLALVGAIDDRNSLPVRPRFLLQILATLLVIWWSGYYIADVGAILGTASLSWGLLFGVPFTVVAAVGAINAMNMLDGVDGLAGGVALVVVLFLAALAALGGAGLEVSVLLVLAGALVGFLLFNFRFRRERRASVFLGDAGSMSLGFLICWFLIDLTQGATAVMTPVTALWLFALPLLDTLGLIVRRLLRGHSPFRPGRDHAHHLLMAAGLSVRRTAFVLIMVQVLFSVIGVAGLQMGVPEWMMFVGFLNVFFLYVFLAQWGFRAVSEPQQNAQPGSTAAGVASNG